MKNQNNDELKTYVDRFGLLFILVLLSLAELTAFISFANLNQYYKASFEGMLTGSAQRPFVTRVFTPWLTVGIKALIPDRAVEILNRWITEIPFIVLIIHAYSAPESLGVESLINIVLLFFSLLGFYYFFIRLSQELLILTKRNLFFLLFVASLGLLPLYYKVGYIYDLPQLFLCTLAFYLIASRKIILYFIVFIFAVLNKETSVVLIIPSMLLFWNTTKPGIRCVLIGLFTQMSIYLLIRVPIIIHFKSNLGETIVIHFLDHVTALKTYPLQSLIYLLALGIIVTMLFHEWKRKPTVISLGACSSFVLFLLFLIGGYPFEFRVFYEVYGILIISVSWSFLLIRGFPIKIRAQGTREFVESLRILF